MPLYLGSLRYRLRIVPDKVLHPPTVSLDGVVGGHALVRALGLLIARDECLLADILRRDVVARRQASLEQDLGSVSLSDNRVVDRNLHVAGALQNIDPVVGVAGWAKVLLG